MDHFEKRKCERKLVRERIIYSFGNIFYSGDLRNVSMEGMFVETAYCLPVDARLTVIMKNHNIYLNLIVKVKRLVRKSGLYRGMGLQLTDRQRRYEEYVDRLGTSVKN